ncbi:ASN_collapsed_G0002380.mRNA.1.CDS.1 [Saccharomyces cerevisiae]|nr:ASN_collapsed_G0002380.mRNA.1.CDS.1 [Saccharomyces cerevisiae]
MEDSAQFFQLEWSGNTKPMEALLDSFFRFISKPKFLTCDSLRIGEMYKYSDPATNTKFYCEIR